MSWQVGLQAGVDDRKNKHIRSISQTKDLSIAKDSLISMQ